MARALTSCTVASGTSAGVALSNGCVELKAMTRTKLKRPWELNSWNHFLEIDTIKTSKFSYSCGDLMFSLRCKKEAAMTAVRFKFPRISSCSLNPASSSFYAHGHHGHHRRLRPDPLRPQRDLRAQADHRPRLHPRAELPGGARAERVVNREP